MRFALATALILASAGSSYAAKNTRFWNLTQNTITKFEMAPAGTTTWGTDQSKNDKDGAVDHDERLKVLGVKSGSYDIRIGDTKGRSCIVKNVAVTEGEVFSIEEKQLAGCGK